ncbi:MAG: glycoside hydrolase family 130 protein [Candidatus Syntropharchaeia archaeon]
MSSLDRTTKKLGDGEIVQIEGETIFKLDSYEDNPIVTPQDLGLTWYEDGEQKIGSVFNGGAEIFRDRVILLPRCHRGYKRSTFFDKKLGKERYYLENYISEVWILESKDGIHFTRFQNGVIRGDGTDHRDFTYGIEDIRVIGQNSRYLLVGCGKIKPPFKGENADRIAIYSTEDFVNITYHGIIESFDSRNAVPFPEPINGRYYMLLRFYPHIHLDYFEAGMEQLLNPSRYREHWRRMYERRDQNLLLDAGRYPHEREKIGPGTQLIRTDEGWLLIYHAVGEVGKHICRLYGLNERIERGYSICAALLDLENPRKILCRTRNPIYIPSAPYELYGNEEYPVDVPAVVFPVGAIVLKGKLVLYAGAGDKYTILLSCNLDGLVDYLCKYCRAKA